VQEGGKEAKPELLSEEKKERTDDRRQLYRIEKSLLSHLRSVPGGAGRRQKKATALVQRGKNCGGTDIVIALQPEKKRLAGKAIVTKGESSISKEEGKGVPDVYRGQKSLRKTGGLRNHRPRKKGLVGKGDSENIRKQVKVNQRDSYSLHQHNRKGLEVRKFL